jgi:hypothetical protein
MGAFLQTVAAGQPLPPMPAGLPEEIGEILEKRVGAMKAL